VKTVFVSYAFPPQPAPRAVQVARLVKFSGLPIRVICAGERDATRGVRPGVDVIRFPDRSSRLWRSTKRFLCVPDSERPWADRVARAMLAEKLIEREDVLVTFGQPMSDHLIGLALKRSLGLRWIAHFSDPWSDNPYSGTLSRLRQRSMEREVIAAADRVLFTSQETVDLVMRKYPAAWQAKASVMAHAFDPLANGVYKGPAETGLVLRHVGNFYGPRNPQLLIRALRLMIESRPTSLTNVKIEFIGRWVGHERVTAASGVPDGLLQFRESIPYDDSLRAMRSANALLIIDAPFEQNVFFPSKLVDYLWARRPILALSPPGASANIVAEAGGMVVAPDKAESIADGLADFLDCLRAGRIGPPDETVVARYDARPIAAAFDRLVASLSN
jgi:glycosyltransferase involved in cell wall biosynthesis